MPVNNDEEKKRIEILGKYKHVDRHTPLSGSKTPIEDVADNDVDISYSNGMTHMYWLPIGIALGTAMGVSTNRLSLWLPLGIILGLLFSFTSRKK